MQNSVQNPAEETFVTHLVELRDRLLKSMLAVLVVFLALTPWMPEIYDFLATPLLSLSPKGMIAIGVTAPFFTSMKATGAVAFLIALPVVLYQMWAFVAPGLYRHERRVVLPLVLSTYVLFLVGIAFAYFFVIPNVFKFMAHFVSDAEKIQAMPDVSDYLNFAFTMFFAFGLAFEVPVAVIVLVYAGALTAKQLVDARPYVIVGAFVVAAVITPPDVMSQLMLAIPMCLLFEVGLFFAKRIKKPASDQPGLEALPNSKG